MMESQGQVMQVRVTNKNDFPIQDRFDGVPFVFEPGKTLPIPSDAAYHIFGFYPEVEAEHMVRHIQKRFGWNTPDMIRSGAGMKFVQNLQLDPVIYKLVPMEEDIPQVAEEKRQDREEEKRLLDEATKAIQAAGRKVPESFLKAGEAHKASKMGLTS